MNTYMSTYTYTQANTMGGEKVSSETLKEEKPGFQQTWSGNSFMVRGLETDKKECGLNVRRLI